MDQYGQRTAESLQENGEWVEGIDLKLGLRDKVEQHTEGGQDQANWDDS